MQTDGLRTRVIYTKLCNYFLYYNIWYCTVFPCARWRVVYIYFTRIRSASWIKTILALKLRGKDTRISVDDFPQLKQCVGEAARMFSNFNETYNNYTDTQLAQLFVNTTACVLAKTRCSYMNPVTGQLQEDDIATKLHLPMLNAIFVNTDYDINIVQLPFRYGSIDVCSKYRNIQQATWPSVAC